MNASLQKALAFVAVSGMCFSQAAFAADGQGSGKTSAKTRHHVARKQDEPAVTAQDLQQLKSMIQAQQQQIDQLRQQLQQREQQLGEAQSAAQAAQDKATAAQNAADEQKPVVSKMQGELADVKTTVSNTAATVQETKKQVGDLEHPTTFHYKGITLTPGGFIAAETMDRSRAENNDVISSFNGIPFNNDPRAHLSEFRYTSRQSRLSLLAQGKVGGTTMSGYYEVDFLGAAPTANENQSSSFNLRQRQLFAQAALSNGWTFTGGQMWSLMTLNKSGIQNRGEWAPAQIDAQYVVGYDFARLAAFRATKTFNNNHTTFGVSLENPATLVGGTVPSGLAGLSTPGTGSLGNGANYSTNVAPDVLAKLAFDPGWGHYEIKGVARFFRDRVIGASNNHVMGGGIGFGMILPVKRKKLDFIAQGLAGTGVARYTDSSNVDVVVRPDGSLDTVKSYSALAGFEAHPNPKLDLYFYGGSEYLGRNYVIDGGKSYGYGSPLVDNTKCNSEIGFSCGANFKNLAQGVAGFWYRFHQGPMGTLQYGMQYSYTTKHSWAGVGGSPVANDNMVFTSFRYVLP